MVVEISDLNLPVAAGVIVVGAGYAGLVAALDLADAGVDVIVLDAADRVGGRVLSEHGPVVLDHGAQWVGPTQSRLLALSERFGCATFPTHTEGENLELWSDDSVMRYSGSALEGGPGLQEFADAIRRLDGMAQEIDLDAPCRTPMIEQWDSETVESYALRTVESRDARRRLALAVQGVWSTEPRDISLFHLLFYVASAGGFKQLMETEGAAQERRFVDGAQAPALEVARELGDRVRLGVRVHAIEQFETGANVLTNAGAMCAERIIVATPPEATTRIQFIPRLPIARCRWLSRSPMGDVAKIHVVYKTPFWRDTGLSGVVSLFSKAPVGVIFDNSPATGSAGVLVAFVYGERLHAWSALDDAERQSAVIEVLEVLFGSRAREVQLYREKIWPRDEFVGGGYAANPSPGTWFEHGRDGWREACGRVHWAGAETASRWNGYIDGAISSGERAAEEILSILRSGA